MPILHCLQNPCKKQKVRFLIFFNIFFSTIFFFFLVSPGKIINVVSSRQMLCLLKGNVNLMKDFGGKKIQQMTISGPCFLRENILFGTGR